MALPLAALIAGGTALLNFGGGLLNSNAAANASRRNTDRTIAANMELSKYAYEQDKLMQYNQNEYNKKMLAESNFYNSPEQQMARLKAAGLNPNMVYGTGHATGGQSPVVQSAQAPKYNAPNVSYDYRPLQVPQLDALGAYQDYELKRAQINQVKANTENINARTVSEALRKSLLDVQERTGEFDLDRREYLRPYEASIIGNKARASEATLEQAWQKVKLMSQEEQLKSLDVQAKEKGLTSIDLAQEKQQAELLFMNYRNEWMAAGVTSSDNIAFRVLVRALNNMGFDFQSLIK